ncbi:MAG TPA: peptidoglycan bridge formation glycyltransferase FemA/FemB family protein [Candidatus Limnocylindria bacterium]|nr:peptidoglycan bridge formation glycyltransferase FemA/FemB family protein [Candidatus Limnocylindria bacterium]
MAGARIRPATDADRAAWDDFLAGRGDADLLQAWGWGECQALAGEEPLRLLAEGPDGELRGVAQVLIRPAGLGRSVAYVAHGPVWQREASDGDRLLGALLDGMREAARERHAIVVKVDPRGAAGEDPAPLRSLLEGYGLRRAPDLQAPTTRLVDLSDGGEQLMASWHADARRLSRRAEREGVEVQVDRTGEAEAIATLHGLLEVTAERAAFRVRSEAFLARLATAFAARDGWWLGIARSEGTPIAAMAMPRLGDRAYYLYGASLRDPQYKHKYGPYAVMATLQRAMAADGVRSLDMWGVVEPDDPEADPAWQGFSAFKRTFGGEPLRHPGTFDLVIDPLWYRLRELRSGIMERLRRG